MVWTPTYNGRWSLTDEDLPNGRRERGRRQQSWKNQVRDFMRSRRMKEDTTEDVWSLEIDGYQQKSTY
jgi:hypothetical protein